MCVVQWRGFAACSVFVGRTRMSYELYVSGFLGLGVVHGCVETIIRCFVAT